MILLLPDEARARYRRVDGSDLARGNPPRALEAAACPSVLVPLRKMA